MLDEPNKIWFNSSLEASTLLPCCFPVRVWLLGIIHYTNLYLSSSIRIKSRLYISLVMITHCSKEHLRSILWRRFQQGSHSWHRTCHSRLRMFLQPCHHSNHDYKGISTSFTTVHTSSTWTKEYFTNSKCPILSQCYLLGNHSWLRTCHSP